MEQDTRQIPDVEPEAQNSPPQTIGNQSNVIHSFIEIGGTSGSNSVNKTLLQSETLQNQYNNQNVQEQDTRQIPDVEPEATKPLRQTSFNQPSASAYSSPSTSAAGTEAPATTSTSVSLKLTTTLPNTTTAQSQNQTKFQHQPSSSSSTVNEQQNNRRSQQQPLNNNHPKQQRQPNVRAQKFRNNSRTNGPRSHWSGSQYNGHKRPYPNNRGQRPPRYQRQHRNGQNQPPNKQMRLSHNQRPRNNKNPNQFSQSYSRQYDRANGNPSQNRFPHPARSESNNRHPPRPVSNANKKYFQRDKQLNGWRGNNQQHKKQRFVSNQPQRDAQYGPPNKQRNMQGQHARNSQSNTSGVTRGRRGHAPTGKAPGYPPPPPVNKPRSIPEQNKGKLMQNLRGQPSQQFLQSTTMLPIQEQTSQPFILPQHNRAQNYNSLQRQGYMPYGNAKSIPQKNSNFRGLNINQQGRNSVNDRKGIPLNRPEGGVSPPSAYKGQQTHKRPFQSNMNRNSSRTLHQQSRPPQNQSWKPTKNGQGNPNMPRNQPNTPPVSWLSQMSRRNPPVTKDQLPSNRLKSPIIPHNSMQQSSPSTLEFYQGPPEQAVNLNKLSSDAHTPTGLSNQSSRPNHLTQLQPPGAKKSALQDVPPQPPPVPKDLQKFTNTSRPLMGFPPKPPPFPSKLITNLRPPANSKSQPIVANQPITKPKSPMNAKFDASVGNQELYSAFDLGITLPPFDMVVEEVRHAVRQAAFNTTSNASKPRDPTSQQNIERYPPKPPMFTADHNKFSANTSKLEPSSSPPRPPRFQLSPWHEAPSAPPFNGTTGASQIQDNNAQDRVSLYDTHSFTPNGNLSKTVQSGRYQHGGPTIQSQGNRGNQFVTRGSNNPYQLNKNASLGQNGQVQWQRGHKQFMPQNGAYRNSLGTGPKRGNVSENYNPGFQFNNRTRIGKRSADPAYQGNQQRLFRQPRSFDSSFKLSPSGNASTASKQTKQNYNPNSALYQEHFQSNNRSKPGNQKSANESNSLSTAGKHVVLTSFIFFESYPLLLRLISKCRFCAKWFLLLKLKIIRTPKAKPNSTLQFLLTSTFQKH